jgi:hypothetical protein
MPVQQKDLFYVALFRITDHDFPTFFPQRPQNEERRQLSYATLQLCTGKA